MDVGKDGKQILLYGGDADLTKVQNGRDGRDFPRQVVKRIAGKAGILIGNEEQLRAIGTGADVNGAV